MTNSHAFGLELSNRPQRVSAIVAAFSDSVVLASGTLSLLEHRHGNLGRYIVQALSHRFPRKLADFYSTSAVVVDK